MIKFIVNDNMSKGDRDVSAIINADTKEEAVAYYEKTRNLKVKTITEITELDSIIRDTYDDFDEIREYFAWCESHTNCTFCKYSDIETMNCSCDESPLLHIFVTENTICNFFKRL